ncbi:unnamed protein product [Allacma fusca]|uniref:Uncharacterized protein n=1 Tax=Allacma fusca TaxID=39272 RepID=A0A8J2KTV2_9HEXA|nr:unnamed protein product [Allacma fusca]
MSTISTVLFIATVSATSALFHIHRAQVATKVVYGEPVYSDGAYAQAPAGVQTPTVYAGPAPKSPGVAAPVSPHSYAPSMNTNFQVGSSAAGHTAVPSYANQAAPGTTYYSSDFPASPVAGKNAARSTAYMIFTHTPDSAAWSKANITPNFNGAVTSAPSGVIASTTNGVFTSTTDGTFITNGAVSSAANGIDTSVTNGVAGSTVYSVGTANTNGVAGSTVYSVGTANTNGVDGSTVYSVGTANTNGVAGSTVYSVGNENKNGVASSNLYSVGNENTNGVASSTVYSVGNDNTHGVPNSTVYSVGTSDRNGVANATVYSVSTSATNGVANSTVYSVGTSVPNRVATSATTAGDTPVVTGVATPEVTNAVRGSVTKASPPTVTKPISTKISFPGNKQNASVYYEGWTKVPNTGRGRYSGVTKGRPVSYAGQGYYAPKFKNMPDSVNFAGHGYKHQAPAQLHYAGYGPKYYATLTKSVRIPVGFTGQGYNTRIAALTKAALFPFGNRPRFNENPFKVVPIPIFKHKQHVTVVKHFNAPIPQAYPRHYCHSCKGYHRTPVRSSGHRNYLY